MRYMLGLGIAALALAIGTGTGSALQGPGGSYQQTCRKIGVRGNTLYAECQDTDRHWRSSQLQDYQRCNGDIQNVNGSLQCGNAGNGYGQPGYNRDRDHDGDHDRDHDHDYRGDRNDDRQWDWDRDHRNRIPRGSYVQSCQNVRVNGNRIDASCQKRNGGWKNTHLDNFQGCRDIENDNGKLRCR
jgi:hypothetical protein